MRKTYGGGRAALEGFDLRVEAGTVHALLGPDCVDQNQGPNGAGKTTAVRIRATLVRFDSGQVWLDGRRVQGNTRWVRARIGFVGQYAAVDEALSGRRNLEMFARLSHLGRRRVGSHPWCGLIRGGGPGPG